jgi:3-oxoacyl-[acyl-carrier protein] reductase
MTSASLIKNRVAIVTGAAAGIGESIAETFAGHGARVVAIDKDEERVMAVAERIRKDGGVALGFHADVRDQSALSKAVDFTLQKLGHIDILINNAGMYPRRRFVDMTEQEWDEIQDVNLKGTFQMTKLVVPHMIPRKEGRIVNISSVTFFLGKDPLSHYVAAKGGVIGFTRALARELGPDGIHVNCISPGAIKTESERTVVSDADALAVIPLQSLRRRIMPVDIANVCVFLCSPLSDGMTGQTLNVDGGWVMY